MSDPVLLDINDRIALITLNRPQRLNALSYDLIDSLMAALDRIEVEAGVRAAIIAGAGEHAFSAGADIDEFSESVRNGADVAIRDFVRRGQAMTARIEAFKKPVIAAVNGLAFGGGCELAIGLVNMVVPHDELMSAARGLAQRIIRHSPAAVGGVITAVTRGLNLTIAEGLLVESEQFAALVPTPVLTRASPAGLRGARRVTPAGDYSG